MSLTKFLTGQPANIMEVAEIAESRKMPVDVLFHTWTIASTVGAPDAIYGETIYSISKYEELIVGKSLKLVQRKKRELGACTGEGMIGELKKLAQPNLRYLSEKSIPYNLKSLNEADD